MVGLLKKSWALFKKDFLENASYKFSFLLNFGGIFANLLSFFFISRLVGNSAKPYLEEYSGSYFPFVIIGIAMSGYLSASMESFANAIGKEQGAGTMESILVTGTGIGTVIIGGAIWDFVFTTIKVAAYLILGVALFGIDLKNANILAASLILCLTIISLSGIGIFSAGLTIMLKRGDPINYFINGFSKFLAGVYFPITILPTWVQDLSHLLPLTYSLEAMRKALLTGAKVAQLSGELGILVLFSATLLPLSILFFRFAIRRVMIDGSLVHY